jgi:hypothetical protein
MKTDKVQLTLKGRCQLAFTCVKKKAHYIKRAYHGEVYLGWCLDHPFKIVLIKHPLGIDGPPLSDNNPPPYPTLNKAEVLHRFKPQEIVRCLDNSAQTLHEISEEVSQDLLGSNITEKNEGIPYREMAGRLYKTAQQLHEMQARELSQLDEDVIVW